MVKFKPIVKIKRVREVGSTGEMIREGEKLKLDCEANGNPSKFQFSWKVDGHKVNGKIAKTLFIPIFLLFEPHINLSPSQGILEAGQFRTTSLRSLQ